MQESALPILLPTEKTFATGRPFEVIEDGESTSRRARPAHDVNNDIDTVQCFADGLGDCNTLRGRNVGRNEMHAFR